MCRPVTRVPITASAWPLQFAGHSAVDLGACRVALVLVSAGIAACTSEASRACASAAGDQGAGGVVSVAVAVRRHSALDLGACRVALVLVSAGIAACTSEASRACACAAGNKGARDSVSVAIAVRRHSAVDLGARRVVLVLVGAGIAACTSEASRACASAAGHKGARDSVSVAIAVRRHSALDLGACRVALVLVSAGIAACTSEASRACACAAGHQCAGDSVSVAVAVRGDGALDLGACRVALVLVSAGIAACTGEASRACASAAGHKRAGDDVSVAIAVRGHSALDLGASRVALVPVGAGIAACTSEASRACACAACYKGAGDSVSVAVAVRGDGALDLGTCRVALVLVGAGIAACTSEASRACASAACHKRAGDDVSVAIAVRGHSALDLGASRVALVLVSAGIAACTSEASRACACAACYKGAYNSVSVAVAVRRHSALDLGACRIVLVLVGAGMAACISEASRACASAAGHEGARDSVSVGRCSSQAQCS